MNQNQPPSNEASRRQFLKSSSTAALGTVLASQLNFIKTSAASATDTLKVGLVGCGGRGTGAANQALHADKNVVLTAVADVFSDKLDTSLESLRKQLPDQVKVSEDNRFVGLDAFQKVLNSGIDVVILATPPGFRPQHFKAAVEANKHIFCEKPMATDVPGIRSVMASVAEAKRKNLAVVAGFCWRYHYARRAIFEKIHNGDIGDIRAIYATYYTGPVKPMPSPDKRPAGTTDLEWQLRNWYNFVWLCGDSLVEQAVHSIDKIAWAMKDVPPLKAVAVGGRQIPNHEGNIYDHFEVNYEYANQTRAFMGSRQQSGCHNQNADYILGTKGTGQISVSRRREVEIIGENDWGFTGPRNDMYQTEHDELFASIRAGKPLNDGDRMCTSTLMAIMGRIAAYTGQEVTWDQVMNSQEHLVPEQLDWNMTLPIRPMAVPGRTPLG
jgi:myo-inositol 2-dehydrogenase / D-chiro-inositol 1-dehydrogenase